MSRISDVFKQPNRKALIAYVTVGYPSVEATLKIVPLLASAGCDMVELGIPFSDPMADGTTIQHASFCALQNGVTPRHCLEVAGQLQKEMAIPLLFMSYYNPIFSYGIDNFCIACADSGVDGLIVPDLPPDEGSELEVSSRNRGLDLIYLLAPTSTEERVRMVARRTTGFIYLVSVTGITGAREKLPEDLDELVAKVKRVTGKPLCVGFGISTPQQAGKVVRIADGVIVGSRIVQLVKDGDDFTPLSGFIEELRSSLDRPFQ